MTTHEGPIQKLEVVGTVVAAFGNVFGAPQRLIKLATIPTAFCLIVSWTVLLSPWRDHPAASLFYLIYMIPMSLLALTWSKDTLTQRQQSSVPPDPWISDYLKVFACYAFWTATLYIWPLAPVAVWLAATYAVAGSSDSISRMLPFVPITWIILEILGIFLFARCYLALPLIVAKRPASPIAAWKFGSSVGLRLGSALLLLAISLIVLAAATFIGLTTVVDAVLALMQVDPSFYDTDYFKAWVALPLAFGLVFPLGSAIATALFAEVLIIAFRKITGWAPAPYGLVERFD